MTIDTDMPAKVETTKANKPRVLKPTNNDVAKQQLHVLGEDDVAKRDTVVDTTNKRVTDTFAFKLNKDSKERYQKTTTFDFSEVTNEELYDLATATVRIIVQRNLRSLGQGALDPSAYATVNVKRDIIDAQPRRENIDPTTKAVRALMSATNMSHEECLKMIEDAQKRNHNAKK